LRTKPTIDDKIDETKFFDAFQKLFSQMVTAKVLPNEPEAHVPTPNVPAPVASTSYLSTGLSKKGSIKPGSNSYKGSAQNPSAASMSTSTSSPGFGGGPPISKDAIAAASVKKAISSVSNIVVQDDEIKTFLTTLKKSNIFFDSTAHQDAHELLNFVLNRLGEDVVEEDKEQRRNRKTNGQGESSKDSAVSVKDVDEAGRTWVHRVFEGVLTNETRCLTCETVSGRQ
jgi:ubiquitin carboxyl-terminal hydrolase 9/13